MDQNEAIETVKRKITDLDSIKIDAQKRATRESFDMDRYNRRYNHQFG